MRLPSPCCRTGRSRSASGRRRRLRRRTSCRWAGPWSRRRSSRSSSLSSTGPDERKAKNLEQNPQCILTTGQNGLDGLDVVVEGRVVEVGDGAELEQVANTYESKYGARFTAPEGTWFGLSDAIRAGKALVYRVTPTTILGFAKGEQFSQ